MTFLSTSFIPYYLQKLPGLKVHKLRQSVENIHLVWFYICGEIAITSLTPLMVSWKVMRGYALSDCPLFLASVGGFNGRFNHRRRAVVQFKSRQRQPSAPNLL